MNYVALCMSFPPWVREAICRGAVLMHGHRAHAIEEDSINLSPTFPEAAKNLPRTQTARGVKLRLETFQRQPHSVPPA